MKITKGIGERIRAKRNELGLTQRDVAEYLGRSASAVTQWESGATYPNGQNLVKLSEILKVDAEWILSGEHSVFGGESTDYDNWSVAGASPTPIFSWDEATELGDAFDALATSITHHHIPTYTGGTYPFVLKAESKFIPATYRFPIPEGALLVLECGKSDVKHGMLILVKNTKTNSQAVIREVIDDGVSLYLAPPHQGLPTHLIDDDWKIIAVVRQIIIDL